MPVRLRSDALSLTQGKFGELPKGKRGGGGIKTGSTSICTCQIYRPLERPLGRSGMTVGVVGQATHRFCRGQQPIIRTDESQRRLTSLN